MSSGSRYVTITDDDHSGHLWVVVCISLGCSFCTILARFASKFRVSFRLGADDYVILAALALLVIQCSLTIAALTRGLGKSDNVINQDHVASMYKLFLASQAFLYAALYAIKVSMVFLIARLFSKKLHPVWIGFTVAGVASVVIVTAGCQEFMCNNSGPLARWSVLTVLDVASELIITAIPIVYLLSIQMSMRAKLKVLLSLNARLICITFAFLNLADIAHLIDRDGTSVFSRPTISVIIPAVYLEAELATSFIAASILPCFRLLFSSSEPERVALSAAETIGSWSQSRHEKRRQKVNAGIPASNPNEQLDLGPRIDRGRSKTEREVDPANTGKGTHSRSSSQESWPAFPRPESRQASMHTKDSQTPFIAGEGPRLPHHIV